MAGILLRPRSFAASSRPCPASSIEFSSISTGTVKPQATMLSAIWRICFLECVRALRGLDLSEAIGRGSTASRARSVASEALLDALIRRLPILTMSQLSF